MKEDKTTNTLMEQYPLLKKNVLLYNDNENSPLLINPYITSVKKVRHLTKNDTLLLGQLTGHKKTRDICNYLPIKEKKFLDSIKKWSSKRWNMLELLDKPIEEVRTIKAEEAKDRNILSQLRQELSSAQEASKDNYLLKEYHQKRICNALDQFEHVETTISHIYKEPHILLGGKNYGASFADVLMERGAIREGISVLEVGGGTGIFGKSFLDQIKNVAPKVYKNIKYSFFEISPVLLRSQREMSKTHSSVTTFIQGDIQNHNFGRKRFDIVISNEMIADLVTVKLKKGYLKDNTRLSENRKRAVSLIKKFRIDVSSAQEVFLFNLGAIEFLHTIKKILKPRGKAYVVEYGSEWWYPRALHLRGHTEYSIHFGFLAKVAKQLSLNPHISLLVDFLPFNKNIKVINYTSWHCINNELLPFLNQKRIPKMVYTKDMIKEKIGEILDKLSFIGLCDIQSKEVLMAPVEFCVLSLERK